jgi:phenylpropionate dioxygenase-like ring-hydroxylating dioxygenase large terminal subunit
MKHDVQVRLIEEMLERLDNGTNVDAGGHRHNPTSVYVDPELAAKEWDAFFRHHPQIIGISGDLPEPGSFMTINDFGVPIIASRDADGSFTAMVNACRHRGALVVEEERGTTRRFTCRFHNWSYDTNGSLAGIPKRDHFGEIDASCNGLVKLPAVEKYGLLWVHPDADGVIDVDALLTPEFAAEIANWKFEELYTHSRLTYDTACNWKLAIDTFGETYHFPALHQNTINLGFHGNVSCYETFGRNHRFLLCKRAIDEMRKLPKEEWSITTATLPAYWLFPNVQLLPTPDGALLVRVYPDPANPGRHISQISLCSRNSDAHSPEEAEARAEMNRMQGQMFTSIIRDEDYVMSASQQTTANSGALSHVVFGRNEPALHHYHNTYREALGMELLRLVTS